MPRSIPRKWARQAGRTRASRSRSVVRRSAPVAEGVGELYVRPPRMAAGYAAGGSLDDRTDDDGFIATGDLARLDPEGFVWIEGRVGDLINRGGNKVFPEEVEEVLKLGPGVRDAAVVGVPDERLGEVPVAFVVADGALDVDALRHALPGQPCALQSAGRFRPDRRTPAYRGGQTAAGRTACRPMRHGRRGTCHERARDDHRRGDRPVAPAHRDSRAASGRSALPVSRRRRVPSRGARPTGTTIRSGRTSAMPQRARGAA